jgi:hypothetical protein
LLRSIICCLSSAACVPQRRPLQCRPLSPSLTVFRFIRCMLSAARRVRACGSSQAGLTISPSIRCCVRSSDIHAPPCLFCRAKSSAMKIARSVSPSWTWQGKHECAVWARLSCTVRGVRCPLRALRHSSHTLARAEPFCAARWRVACSAVRCPLHVVCCMPLPMREVKPFSAPAAAKRCLAWLLGTTVLCTLAHRLGCVHSADSRPARPPQDARTINVLPTNNTLSATNDNHGTCSSQLQYLLLTR